MVNPKDKETQVGPDTEAYGEAGEQGSASDWLLGRLARRLQNPRELGGDAKLLVGTLLETSDRAKTEMVKMVAREFRTYLEELKLKEDLHQLLLNHSLEVNMSLSLKKLASAVEEPASAGDEEGE